MYINTHSQRIIYQCSISPGAVFKVSSPSTRPSTRPSLHAAYHHFNAVILDDNVASMCCISHNTTRRHISPRWSSMCCSIHYDVNRYSLKRRQQPERSLKRRQQYISLQYYLFSTQPQYSHEQHRAQSSRGF